MRIIPLPLLRTVVTTALFAAIVSATGPSFADSIANGSGVAKESGEAVGAGAESGLKTAVGVSAAPIAVAGSGVAVAGSAGAASAGAVVDVGVGSVAAGADSAAFGREPLSITDTVVVGPAPDGPPEVPFAPPVRKKAARQP